jgi:hypothetical protein
VTSSASGFPSAGLLDTFDRPDGVLGGNWSGSVGSYGIAGGQLDVNGNGSIFWNATVFGVTQEAYVTVATMDPAAGGVSLVLKSQSANTSGSSGMIRVLYNPGSQAVQISTYSNAQGWVQRGGSVSVTLGSGDRFGARVRADGMVEVYKNEVLMGVRDASGWTYAGGGGYVGLWMASAPNLFLDDFGGG